MGFLNRPIEDNVIYTSQLCRYCPLIVSVLQVDSLHVHYRYVCDNSSYNYVTIHESNLSCM